MKNLIVYSSKSGNTRKLAEAVYDFLPVSWGWWFFSFYFSQRRIGHNHPKIPHILTGDCQNMKPQRNQSPPDEHLKVH